jgi:hypothetical protein
MLSRDRAAAGLAASRFAEQRLRTPHQHFTALFQHYAHLIAAPTAAAA